MIVYFLNKVILLSFKLRKGSCMENPKIATQHLAKKYADRGDPNGWFEEFYTWAEGDIRKVYWADLKPNPLLLTWIDKRTVPADARAFYK